MESFTIKYVIVLASCDALYFRHFRRVNHLYNPNLCAQDLPTLDTRKGCDWHRLCVSGDTPPADFPYYPKHRRLNVSKTYMFFFQKQTTIEARVVCRCDFGFVINRKPFKTRFTYVGHLMIYRPTPTHTMPRMVIYRNP